MKHTKGRVLVALGDPASPVRADGKRPKARTSPKYGDGKFCVFSSNGKKVRCFHTRQSAERVARGFGRGFTVKGK